MTFKNVYVGGTLCKNVHLGTQLVWTQAPQTQTFARTYSTRNGGTRWIYLTRPGMPTALFDYPDRVVEVRLSTGLVLPYDRVASSPEDGMFAIMLTDTLANLGVPTYTTVTVEITYLPE